MNEQRIKITDPELKKTLEELFRHYYDEARRLSNEADEESAYMEAKSHGGVDAVSAIYRWLYGGEEMNKLWMSEVNRHDETAGS